MDQAEDEADQDDACEPIVLDQSDAEESGAESEKRDMEDCDDQDYAGGQRTVPAEGEDEEEQAGDTIVSIDDVKEAINRRERKAMERSCLYRHFTRQCEV